MKINLIRIAASILLLASVSIWSCTKENDPPAAASMNPVISALSLERAAANTLVSITGTGLGGIQYIKFSKGDVTAAINPTLNTDKALLFRVPEDAVPGMQEISFTNSAGIEFRTPFQVLGFALITQVSNFNFIKGTELTLTGKNLEDVTQVLLTGTTTEATVKSKTATTVTIVMPAFDQPQTTLDIINESGPSTTTQQFVAIDNAYKFFTEGYDNGTQDASWGAGGKISSEVARSGTKSVYKDYQAGNWHQFGFGWNEIPQSDGYKFLSFWMKGGSKDMSLYISTESSKGGFASTDEFTRIDIPADVWTYYKVSIDELQLYSKKPVFKQLGFRIKGPDGQDERFYIDDLVLIK
jgi:hypothetical protein